MSVRRQSQDQKMDSVSNHWDIIHLTTSGKLEGTDLTKAYDDWATNYDEDYSKAQYNGPRLGSMKLSEVMTNKSGTILDVASGTGLVGKELQQLGYTNIDGIDVSEECLKIAQQTGHYANLVLHDINASQMPYNEDTFDALICVGTFTPGHLNQSNFPEFIRVVKPGGFIVIAMRENYIYTAKEFRGGQLDAAIIKHVEDGNWHYLCRDRVSDWVGEYTGTLFAFQVCAKT